MRQLHGVLWTRGTLLTPQHLQVQDQYLQELMHFRLSSLSFRPWGFQRLDVDREALADGSVALNEASGVFPDGLAFDLPDSDPAPRPLSLEDAPAPAEGEGWTVHLAVPEHREGGRNVSSDGDQGDARFRSEVILRRDENTGRSEKPIQVARKNLRLSVGDGGGSSLPVARVVRSAAGEYQLDPAFVPPLVDFAASERLKALARRLVEVMAARSSELSESRRQRGADLADFGVSDVASFWLLYTLNTHLPVLRHLYETRGGHPSELYDAMLRLAGSLTTFSSEIVPSDLPTYDHQALGECFSNLEETIHTLLATVIPQRHVSLPLREIQRSIHATALDQDRYLSATAAYLAVRSDKVADDELARRFPQLAKVGSGDRVERLVKQALPGVTLRAVGTPPEAIPVKLGRTYFELDRNHEDWQAVRQARNLAVYVPSDFPGTELELVLLLPAE